jgi:hypothetical protein
VSITELSIFITCMANTVGIVGGLFVSLRNSKKITEVHESTNGKMDALISEVRVSSFARGVKSEKDKE